MPHRSDSAADAAGLQRLGLCIAGVKQLSASHGERLMPWRSDHAERR